MSNLNSCFAGTAGGLSEHVQRNLLVVHSTRRLGTDFRQKFHCDLALAEVYSGKLHPNISIRAYYPASGRLKSTALTGLSFLSLRAFGEKHIVLTSSLSLTGNGASLYNNLRATKVRESYSPS